MHVNVLKAWTVISLLFFFLLTHTNVLMDTGDKDNKGEEGGKEEQRTEGQYDTHTQTDEAENSQGS